MTNHRRGILLGVAVLVAVSACLMWWSGKNDEHVEATGPVEVGVIQVTPQAIALTTELPGTVLASEVAEVRPQVTGVVRQRHFIEGSAVEKGQLLYSIEDAPFRAAVSEAEGRLAESYATIESTQARANRYEALYAQAAVSRQDMELARAAAAQAAASVRGQQGALALAQSNLEFTRIRAPIGGRIGRSFVTVGGLVQTGQPNPLSVINQTREVFVDVTQSVHEQQALKARLAGGALRHAGDDALDVRLRLPDGSTHPMKGRFGFEEAVADPTTGSIVIRLMFPNADGRLIPGMAVRAVLTDGISDGAILVPQRAVSRDERGRGTALVVDASNTVQRRFVEADRTVGRSWLVESGLRAGDRVVVNGLARVRVGAVVIPIIEPLPAVDASRGGTGR